MTDPKLRDALAERLQDAFKATDGVVNLVDCRYVASRLLESIPGEEELAKELWCSQWPEKWNIKEISLEGMEPTHRECLLREARFLRSKIAGWVG